MSVTLKALQQIERERDLHQGGQRQKNPPQMRPAGPGLSAGSAVGRRMRKSRTWLAMAALTVAAAGLIIGDRWGYRWRAAVPEARGRTDTRASTMPAQVVEPLGKPSASSTHPQIGAADFAAQRPALSSPTDIERSATDPADSAVPPSLAPSGSPPPAPPESPSLAPPGSPSSAPPGWPSLAPSGSPPPAPPESPPPAPPESPPSAPPELDRLQDIKTYAGDRLKIQAIVWGPEEPQRMAVINDQVVYTGDRFGQWVLTRIEEDAVIVQEEHTFWRVFLGR